MSHFNDTVTWLRLVFFILILSQICNAQDPAKNKSSQAKPSNNIQKDLEEATPTDFKARLVSKTAYLSYAISFSNHSDNARPVIYKIKKKPSDPHSKDRYFVVLHGRRKKKEFSVFYHDLQLKINESSDFVFEVPVEDKTQEFVLKLVSSDGEVLEYGGEVQIRAWDILLKTGGISGSKWAVDSGILFSP